jgi:magnesium transporter
VLNRLARDEFEVVDARDRIFFRDIYDHLVRLHDLNESMRDLVSGALDAYLSVINNRMNEAMRTLTVITTLFMPLSFIVGFFGMNFFLPHPPISEWMVRPVFYVIIVLIASTPIVMYRWMRSRTWI